MQSIKGSITGSAIPDQMAEIPAGIESIYYELNELQSLLSNLHQRLESIMPPAAPECDALAAVTREPVSQLGQTLAEQARRLHQSNDSVRNLLGRIKL